MSTDNKNKKDGYHVTISFVQPTVISGFVEADSEEEANAKIQEDFQTCSLVKVINMEEMDSETAEKLLNGDVSEETPTTLQ